MMDALFVSVLNMSITASLVVLVVVLVRLFLKKAPKGLSYALWIVVLFRLICPFSFESVFAFLPINATPIPQDIIYQAQPQIDTGIPIINNSINPLLPAPPETMTSVNPLQIWTFIGSHIWLVGMVVLLIYSIVQFVKLKRKLIGATPLRDNIYIADHISSPFVMGFIKPKIYLPSSMAKAEQSFIIAHENYHIKRFDHITRILAFVALTIHWFNPLVWFAFVLSGKDMEMSCDEAVMKKMNADIRAEYSQSLLRFATGKKLITATPLAFGEGDTKDRVKNVMKYKKPMLWVSVIAIIAVICVAVGLMSNPKTNLQTEDFNTMIVGAELPYLLYANNDYCIMNMWHGGVIVYDFTTQKISDRIAFEKLKETGFSYPVPMVSENGQIIYFREDSQTSKQPYTYSYNLQTKKLDKETDDVKDVIHYESIYENQLTQAILSDGLAYGATMIVLDDTFIVSRLTAGGSLLSDTEIVFIKKNLTPEKTFYLYDNQGISDFKGVELYVWKDAIGETYFTLLSGTNRNKIEEEIYDKSVATTDISKIANTLLGFDDGLHLFIIQMNEADFTKDEMAAYEREIITFIGENIKDYSISIGLFKSARGKDISEDNAKYTTEADFLNHPDGVEFQAVAYKAAKAYLNGDKEELSVCISENCIVDVDLDLFKDIDYMILKWSLNDIKAEDKIHAAYEFKLKGEDSVSFVSMELIRIDSQWKVDSIGIEK